MVHAAMPIEEIWQPEARTRFRELEREVVADVCAAPDPLVIACGGGAVVDPDNRRRLRDAGVVVWLRAPTAVLAARVGNDATRPLLAGDPAGALGAARRGPGSGLHEPRPTPRSTPKTARSTTVADAVLDAFAELAS